MRLDTVQIRPRPCELWGRAGWLVLLVVALSLSSRRPLAAEDWPQFRGPNCTGVSAQVISLGGSRSE